MNVTEIRLRLLIAYAAPTSRNSNALVYSAASSTRITTPNEIQRYQRTAPKIAKPCRLGFRKETSPPVWWKISSFCLCSHFLSLWGVLNKGCRSPCIIWISLCSSTLAYHLWICIERDFLDEGIHTSWETFTTLALLLWRGRAILIFFLAGLEKLLKLTSKLWVQPFESNQVLFCVGFPPHFCKEHPPILVSFGHTRFQLNSLTVMF